MGGAVAKHSPRQSRPVDPPEAFVSPRMALRHKHAFCDNHAKIGGLSTPTIPGNIKVHSSSKTYELTPRQSLADCEVNFDSQLSQRSSHVQVEVQQRSTSFKTSKYPAGADEVFRQPSDVDADKLRKRVHEAEEEIALARRRLEERMERRLVEWRADLDQKETQLREECRQYERLREELQQLKEQSISHQEYRDTFTRLVEHLQLGNG